MLLLALLVGSGSTPAVAAAPATHSITGSVTETYGQGVGGLDTYACPTPPLGGPPSCPSGMTGADGTFTITGIAPRADDVSVADPLDAFPSVTTA